METCKIAKNKEDRPVNDQSSLKMLFSVKSQAVCVQKIVCSYQRVCRNERRSPAIAAGNPYPVVKHLRIAGVADTALAVTADISRFEQVVYHEGNYIEYLRIGEDLLVFPLSLTHLSEVFLSEHIEELELGTFKLAADAFPRAEKADIHIGVWALEHEKIFAEEDRIIY